MKKLLAICLAVFALMVWTMPTHAAEEVKTAPVKKASVKSRSKKKAEKKETKKEEKKEVKAEEKAQ